MAHFDINTLRNKFGMLKTIVKNQINILLVSKTKLDDSFPKCQLCIDGFTTPYRLDRNENDTLKVVAATFLLVCIVCLKESTCETRKNALFVLEIIKFPMIQMS